MLIPKITPYDTKIIPQMYKDGYILTAIYDNKIFWHINQSIQYEEESQDKKAMYEKMKELKRDPEAYKELEAQALSLITQEQRRSQACNFHRDKKLRELIMEMIQE